MRSNLFGTSRRIPRARYVLSPLLGVILLLLAGSGVGEAQEMGRIVGRVISTQTGEGLASVRVSVVGADIGMVTDVSGRYSLSNVPGGIQSLSVQAAGYASKTVTDVEVAASGTTTLDISVAPEALALEGLTVTAERERGSTSTLLSERMRAPVVQDAIGQEQIGRTPDSDAAEALKRVPGVTVVDGQFVYARGLGERYGSSTLNGAPMPSPLPDKKAIPLDVIPANLLESIVVSKTYSPNQPGDYAGGLVQIQTRSVPTARTLRLSTSVGYNTAASLRAANTTRGGDLDFLGFGGGERELPDELLDGGSIAIPTNESSRQAFATALTRGFGLEQEDAPLNQSYSIAYGDEWLPGGTPLGVIGTLSLSNSYGAPEENNERVFTSGLGGAPGRDVDFEVQAGEHETSLGSLLGISFELAPAQRITATGTYTRLVEDQSRQFIGAFEDVAEYVESYQTRYIANSIANLQLRGEHLIERLGGLQARWRTSYGRAERDEPGTRTAAYAGTGPEDLFFISTSSSGLVFAQDLQEDLVSGGVDLELPFTFRALPAFLSIGGSGDLRDRSVFTQRIFLSPVGGIPGDIASLRPGELFVPERIGTTPGRFEPRSRTFPEDNFDADQTVLAGYAMIDAEVLPRLRAVVGARVERANQNVDIRGRETASEIGLKNTDILPALNLTYALRPTINLRAATSRTVARPEFRERAPFLYEDFFGGLPTRGNPFLNRASIINYDLRGEWLSRSGALLSVSGFAKQFDDPIEPVFFNLGANRGQSFANSESAIVYGAEFEVRTPLGLIVPALENFTFTGNLTLAESRVEGDSVVLLDAGTRGPLALPVDRDGNNSLFGQSPYAVNLGLSYFRPGSGTTATVLFNGFGRRLDARGINEVPDIYEEGRSQFDVVVEQPLGSSLALKVSAERLLGGEVEFTQEFADGETVATREYDLGSNFAVSLSWEPWGGR